MSEFDHVGVVQFFLSLSLLYFAYTFMYRRAKRDRFREDLFTIRDSLFDYIWQNELSYELPAYQELRDLLNGAIRFAAEMSFTSLLLYRRALRDVVPESSLLETINSIEDLAVRKRFLNTYQEVGIRMAKHVLPFPIGFLLPSNKMHPLRFRPAEDQLVKLGKRHSAAASAMLSTCPPSGEFRNPFHFFTDRR